MFLPGVGKWKTWQEHISVLLMLQLDIQALEIAQPVWPRISLEG